MTDDFYPPSAFHFEVAFDKKSGLSDTSFQEVSGIKATIETETYTELGENGSVYHLPKTPSYDNLQLKRGIADAESPLVKWCSSIFDSDFSSPIKPANLLIHLMDANGNPIRSWSFVNAFPVSWNIDSFNSTKNEVAIETIELRYSSFTRVI
jgi:phage tail-like protein